MSLSHSKDHLIMAHDWELVDDTFTSDGELLFDYKQTTEESNIQENKETEIDSGEEADNDTESTTSFAEVSNPATSRRMNKPLGNNNNSAAAATSSGIEITIVPSMRGRNLYCRVAEVSPAMVQQTRDIEERMLIGIGRPFTRFQRVRDGKYEDKNRTDGSIWQRLRSHAWGIALDLGRIVELTLPCLSSDGEEYARC